MTIEVEQWYKNQWADNVIIRYQNRGFVLKGTTEGPVQIDGDKFYFLRTGQIEAQPYSKGDAVSGLNPEDDKVEMKSTEWDAAVELYDFDQSRITPNEAQTRQEQCARALGRRSDMIIYDAVMGAQLERDQVFGSYTQPFDPYLFKQGLEKLIDNDVETEVGVFAPLPSLAYSQLETYQIFANADWIGGDLPLTKMVKHKSWDIANCFILPPHLRQKYTSGTELRFRIWAKSAIGAGHNDNVRNEWTREGRYKRYLVNHTIDGVAVPLQTAGIIEFQMKADSKIESEIVRTDNV